MPDVLPEMIDEERVLAAFGMGLVGGQRALTPFAAVSVAAARGEIERPDGALGYVGNPVIAAGSVALAALEMAGDKQKSAPDRIVIVGLAARFLTSALAGAMLSQPGARWRGAAIGGVTAVAAAFPGWMLRMRAMRPAGQSLTGFVEDGLVLAGAAAAVRGAAR